MLAKIGHKVRDLTRTRIGPLTLEGLGIGKFRPLTAREVRGLREFVEQKKPKGRWSGRSPNAADLPNVASLLAFQQHGRYADRLGEGGSIAGEMINCDIAANSLVVLRLKADGSH